MIDFSIYSPNNNYRLDYPGFNDNLACLCRCIKFFPLIFFGDGNKTTYGRNNEFDYLLFLLGWRMDPIVCDESVKDASDFKWEEDSPHSW